MLRAADVIGSRLKSVSRTEGSDDGHNGHTNSNQRHLSRRPSVHIGTSRQKWANLTQQSSFRIISILVILEIIRQRHM